MKKLAFPFLSDPGKKATAKPTSEPSAVCLWHSLNRPEINQNIWNFVMDFNYSLIN